MQVLQKTQKIVRYQNQNGEKHFGIVEGEIIQQLSSSFTELVNNEIKFDGERVKFSDVKVLEPVEPSKVINFGWTYADHAKETGGEANRTEPFLFLKPLSSLIPNKEKIILPPKDLTNQVELEGELALVIGKRGKNIKEEDALDYVFGCTIFNDVTARDLTRKDPQFTRGKGFDTFGPLG
ncbi:fumarylacetoacetate hydrolase family protein, partial [Terribacillus saccharophilus]|uniref:fumarylacetoacetate hydrolase family protein n=1 Tax=Terribacillus saccharophilus TaxID=361277 RepID=UPI002DD2373F|nr:fumarylacetoacetate hydrolase family protein [Terribacillus saccharophilus]